MAISDITTGATALSNLILVTPQKTIGYQPQDTATKNGKAQITQPTLMFHYEGENTATLESDITDHYVEDNTAINDHISLRPEKITTAGYIGELNDIPPEPAFVALKAIADKLTVISAYTPQLTSAAIIAYNEALFAYNVAKSLVNSSVSTWNTINGDGGQSVINGAGISTQKNQTKQQKAFQQFYGYWRKRTLFTVQTPWAVFQDMAITSIRAVQDAATNSITDFEVSFKLMRFASTITTKSSSVIGADSSNASGRAATYGPPTDMGTYAPPFGPLTLADSIAGVR